MTGAESAEARREGPNFYGSREPYLPVAARPDVLVGLTRNEIVQLVSNAFTVAWLDETRRASYLERVHSYVDRN